MITYRANNLLAGNVNHWGSKMSFEKVQRRPLLVTSSRLSIGFSVQVFLLVAFLTLVILAPIQAAGQVLLGDQAIENSPDGSSAGMAEAFQATASMTGTLGSLTVYLDSSSRSRQVFVGLYADAGGHPGALLVQASNSTPRAGAWNVVTISPVGVTAGTRYWIAILGTRGTLQFRDSNGGCTSESSAQSSLAALPASWSSGAIWSTCRLSAYGSAAASSQPVLSLSPSTLSFAATQGNTNPAPASVNVTNGSTGTLNFTASNDVAWLSVSPPNGTAPQSLQVSAVTAGMSANTYIGHLTITAPGSQGSPGVVTVTLNLSAPAPPLAPVLNSLGPANATAGSSGFTLTANGTNFVSGDVLLWNGAALTTNLVSATQLTATVPANLVASVGTASVVVQPPSRANSNALNFAINAPPAPTISSLSPASTLAGGPSFTLTVIGMNYVSGDLVLWNGTSLTTTFSSSTQLTAAVPASLIANAGTASVTVQPPASGSGSQSLGSSASNAINFTINPVSSPAVNSLSPSSATMGGPGFALTVNGSNFISGDTVQWNGTSLSTAFVNATQLTAAVPASLVASVGTFNIGVHPPSGTTSNLLSFVVNSASPAVLIGDQTVEASPDSNSQGGTEAFQSKALGTGTVTSLVVYLDGASASTQLLAGLYADSGGHPGTLLSQGSSTTLKSAAWNTIHISAVNVTAGTNYWIAILGTGGTLRFRDGSSCTSESSAQTNLTLLPSNWTSGSTWPSCPLSAYGVSGGSGGPPSTFIISGTISSAANGADSTVALSGAANATTSANASGNYSFTGLLNGNYTVTPSKPGFSFSPGTQNVAVNGASLSGVNFAANVLSTSFTISGTVSPVANGVGSTLALSGAASDTTIADSAGNYSFGGLSNGSYTVTPGKTGFSFSPSVQQATIRGSNVSGVNFTATTQPPTFAISGTISPSASGIGATVTLGGTAAGTTIVDSSGNYVFTGINNGSYTLTPSKTGFTFSPSTQTANVSGTNVAGINFTAASSTPNGVFFDDFLAASLDPAWTALNRAGDVSGNELQCNTPANVALAGGNLLINTQQQSISCGISTMSYTSGAIQWTSFNFTYGTVEYRMKLPSGSGLRPVAWLLGSDCQASNIVSPDNIGGCNWPFPGSEEIDVTEIIGSNYNQINQGMISSAGDHGCVPNIDVSVGSGYHTYQLVWSPGSLVWKVDGATTCSVSSAAVPSSPMFLIVETTVGGSGGSVDNSTLPQTTYVDYVKVTQP